MNIGMLVRGEMLKTTRRMGARVAALGFLGICILSFTGAMMAARRHLGAGEFAFPHVWAQVLEPFGPISTFIAAVVVIMLTANEFTWRTARQNVIDGLSKQEWFVAKLLNAVIVCALFAAILLITAAAFAATAPFETVLRASDAKMLGAYLIALLGIGSVAFFLSMLFRRDGAALGVLLIWASLGETLVMLLLHRFREGWEKYGQYLPFRVFFSIFSPRNWDAAAHAGMVEFARKAHRPLPELPDMQLLLALAVGYIIAFTAISYANYMKRDL
jgi:ABC-type transport system involved in multi-copper enzyme maturation permease subunit